GEPPKPSETYRLFSGQPPETLLLLQAESDQSRIWEYASFFWEKLRHITPDVNGRDLLDEGYKPGPDFQEVLDAIRDARLDGLVGSREEELALAKKLFSLKENNNA
ncbi:MAG: prohead protease, partial [Bacillota bacterium]|nr:prohead protease [Bacillota bacterium]